MTALPVWLRYAYQVLLIVGALACWIFIGRYMARYRWWTTDIGRHLISMSTVVGSFYTYFAVATVWPEMPGRVWIRTFLFFALTTILVWRLVMFERLRLKDRKIEEK